MKRLMAAAAAASFAAVAADQRFVEGAAQSPVRVVIYEDLQCPDCANFRTMLDEKLLPRYGGTVAFEHHDFPLAKHAWARKAAIGARFLDEAKPGAGLAFRQFVMANLDNINSNNFIPIFSDFAVQRGIGESAAHAALADQRLADLVEKDYQEGVARGIARTPTVLINGRPFIETFTFEEVAKAIEAELAAAK